MCKKKKDNCSNEYRTHWKISDDEASLIDEKVGQFVFSQGEKYLDELCKIKQATVNRSYTLIGIMVAVCPFLITTSISLHRLAFTVVAGLFALMCIVLCFILLSLIKPRYGFSPGRRPSELITTDILHAYKEYSVPIEYYELENLQNKIENTEKYNEQTCSTYGNVLKTLLIGFSVMLASSVYFTCL